MTMIDNKFLQDLSNRLSAVLPKAGEIGADARTKMEQQLKKSFASLDLLSREEFEGQVKALQRAEQRIGELETTIAGLESKLDALDSA